MYLNGLRAADCYHDELQPWLGTYPCPDPTEELEKKWWETGLDIFEKVGDPLLDFFKPKTGTQMQPGYVPPGDTRQTNTAAVIGVGLLAVGAISGVIYLVTRKKKGKK